MGKHRVIVKSTAFVLLSALVLTLTTFYLVYPTPIVHTPINTPTNTPQPTPTSTPLNSSMQGYKTGKPVCSYPPLEENRTLPDAGHVCIIIRSYYGHVNSSLYSLATLYDCFEQFEYQNWTSYVFYIDNHPVLDFNLVGEARAENFRSKYHVVDTPYHYPWECTNDCGYTATDWAIYNICPKDSRWLLVTQGDNEYAPDFLSHLDTQYDAVGFNWFSRYTKPGTAAQQPANRFSWVDAACEKEWRTACMKNVWDVGRNDLGAVIWNYQRFVQELKSYARFNPNCCHDGHFARDVVSGSKWKVKDVSDCLYSHNPNPWSECMRRLNKFQT